MKKFLILFVALFIGIGNVAFADDVDMPATGGLWDNWNTREEGRDAKPVSDEDFEKALKQVDKKINKRKYKLEKKNMPKGEEFSQSNETELIAGEHSDKDSLPVVSLPVELLVGEDVVPIGHYQVKGEKVDGNYVLKLYQAHYEIAQFPAIETEDDFGEDIITFAKWTPEGSDKIKIMYGSLEFNAYTIIDIRYPEN
ncbi:hypothetical protein HDR58_04140 [bacterium]|nr:hypothetical protein [bacterium]